MSTKVNFNENEAQQFVTENINVVPRNQQSKFNAMTLEQKYAKIKFYIDMQKLREDAREKNKLINRVKDLFDKRHATVDEVREVMNYCNDFINTARDREIAAIDEEIAKLQAMKTQLTN